MAKRHETKILPDAPALGATSNLDMLVTSLLQPVKRKYTKEPGEGVRRAQQRLAERRKANTEIPDTQTVTRQLLRQTARLRATQELTIAKAEAQRANVIGGAAVVREL